MTLDDSLPMLTSRARRAVKRASGKNYRYKLFLKKIAKIRAKNAAKVIKTQLRDAVILPSWLGLTFGIHDGKSYKNILISLDKIGYRLGDFAHSTGRVLHSGPGVGATRGSKFIPLK
jgi:small subunit ribosomal protein S19